jgi:hypothetical protein
MALALVIVCLDLILSHWIADWRIRLTALGCFVTGYAVFGFRTLWRFGSRTRDFLTARSRRFVLRYDPWLRGTVDTGEVLQQADEALREIEVALKPVGPSTLGWPFVTPSLDSTPVNVYLFPGVEAVGEVFNNGAPAFALWQFHAVAIPFTGLPLRESLRHELAHLFVRRPWNRSTPLLLSEGLPTWLQATAWGVAVDRVAAYWVGEGKGELRPLLYWKTFLRSAERFRSYALAGSFTGFLFRRFGREAYVQFYNEMANGWRFDAKFAARFGLTLEAAENEWHQELVREYGTSPGVPEGRMFEAVPAGPVQPSAQI